MSAAATRSTQPVPTLHLAFDLGNRIWKLAFATTIAHAPRLRTMPARGLTQLGAETAAAKARFGLASDVPVVSCYEVCPLLNGRAPCSGLLPNTSGA